MSSPSQPKPIEARLIVCPLCSGNFIYSRDDKIHRVHEGTLYACCRLYRNVTDSVESKQEHMNSLLPMEDKLYIHHTKNRSNDTIFPNENTV